MIPYFQYTSKCWMITISVVMIILSHIVLAQEIPFEHLIIDRDARGHREVGDINGDGYNDIVAVNYTDSEFLLVWYKYPLWEKNIISDGKTFPDYKDYRADEIVLADIDRDGDEDLVGRIGKAKDVIEGLICWFENPGYLNNIKNTNWKRHNIGETIYIKDFEVDDFNRDGKLDIVGCAYDTVYIFFQNNIDSWERIKLDIHSHEGMDSADLDRDGDPDIVLNGFWLETPENPLSDLWLEHNIDEKWWNQPGSGFIPNACKVAVADMNNDGCPDVIYSHSENIGYPVSWYEAPLDPGEGQWLEHIIGYVDKCHNLKTADFDNDGDIDVLAGELVKPVGAPFPLGIFINRGDASIWTWQKLTDRGNYSDQIGDIDNDGDIDIIGLGNYDSPPIEMWRNKTSDNKLNLNKWTYIQVDNDRSRHPLKQQGGGGWFGLAMGDFTGDGYKDIVSGKWFYQNPAGDMTDEWNSKIIDDSIDVVLVINVDDDEMGDCIALKCNQQYWIEAKDKQGNSWEKTLIGSLPICNHGTGAQGYLLSQIIPGGKPEILLTGGGIYYLQIPDNPLEGNWPAVTIADSGSNGEGISAGDIDRDGDLDISAGYKIDKIGNGIAWWENPGDGSAHWKKQEIGTAMNWADRFSLADINGDQRLDVVVAEETRQPPIANLVWFEQPSDLKNGLWQSHTVVTEYSLNNLDVADLDRDGDVDIVICEHKGSNQKLQIWENDATGNFREHLIDRGKESHLGSRLADMDNDGDLDIISIAWTNYQYLHLWRNDAIKKEKSGRVDKFFSSKINHQYLLPLEVNTGEFELTNKPAEIDINFTQLLQSLEQSASFDDKSLRILEVTAEGEIFDESIIFQFDKNQEYQAKSNASGRLVFLLKGTTPAHRTRYFYVLFNGTTTSAPAPPFAPQVFIKDNIKYQGQSSFEISTQNAIYYYHKQGSGFAGMIDRNGNNWISYFPGEGPAGEYRGIPNISPAGFHPGPGDNNLESKIIGNGPLKVTILSETRDKKWGCTWEIYPNYAQMTLFKKGEGAYWILYEGTPGGKLDLERDFWLKSNGERGSVSQEWAGDIPSPEWIVFGDSNLNRVLYLIHHEDDSIQEKYWPMRGQMTVFGFGRDRNAKNKAIGLLESVPTHLTIGFANAANGDFNRISRTINSVYRDLVISVGEPEVIGDGEYLNNYQ